MRIIKQLIYGALYLTIFGGIALGIYHLSIGLSPSCFDDRLNQGEAEIDCGGPCMSCELKNLKPLRTSVESFGVDGSTNVVINLANPNLNYGAESFSYTLNFYNRSQEKIFSLTKDSFIYSAEAQKILLEPNLKIDFNSISGKPELILENFKWKPISEFQEPEVQTRQVRTEASNRIVTVSGLLSNRESFGLSRVVVGALIYRKLNENQNELFGISKTVLQSLKPFEERSFKIPVPINLPLGISELEAIVTTEVER